MRRVSFPGREIERFGSTGFRHSRIARGELQVNLVELDGVIGGHDAASRQVLLVISGRVTCATRDETIELGAGEAVEWQEGEWHETRALTPSRLLIVEGTFD